MKISLIHHSYSGATGVDTVRQITNELAIAGQPTLDELQQLAEAGYRSVVNLRSPDETGFLNDEQQKIEYLRLLYINVSISKNLNFDDVLLAIQQINQLPTPILATPGALVPQGKAIWYQQHLPNIKVVHVGAGMHYL